nr:MAG TPA: hypothetical protein [Caudoviricetes sp.]
MKIYPNSSNIMVTNSVNVLTDIPLSYIDTAKLEYRLNTVINSDFQNKIKQEVLPYEKMNKNIICLFDKNGNKIDSVELTKHLKREDSDYVFVPYGSVTFAPKVFEYNVTAKKSIVYNSKMQYNINVAVENDALANALMPIFGDAPTKCLAPSNILINNGAMGYSDLISTNTKNKDIYFISRDAINNEDIDKPFQNKTNVFKFISAVASEEYTNETVYDSESVHLYMTETDTEYAINSPLIYDSASISTNLYFNVPKDKAGIKYHNLFNSDVAPILLEEHEGKGFVIYSIEDINRNITKYSKIMYEIIFYIYSKCYVKTEQYNEWIADKVPDYIVVNGKLTKKERFISQLELHKMFGLNQYEVTPYEIDIDEELYPFVKFTGLTNNYLTFEKDITGDNDKYQDPANERNAISIFTSRQDIIYFDNFLYKIDDSLEECIKIERVDNIIKATIKPFRHSSSGIYVKTLTSLDIPLTYKDATGNTIQITNIDYYIVCKQNESASYLEYVESSKYTNSHGLILATIQVRQDETKTLVYDMRQRGGGLPESEKDNYNCFDIGHIYGRPYRKGGSTIITLPKKLEPHKEMIMETVKQYCVAEEYPIIIFKED